ncbi:GNAT family N-acetyltransferase [Arthrobacter sp. Y-9]|uniref:GNAT family N-acetyltransferase n=1 Tax=Arthrobacter sp. Y-9 TaxID=3039385 RepID=UPI00241DA055|nr:GNAT family N-acetyltransferase [Arthrobacter sp. Y-9]WFR83382.1 GNAT family N-acetyltransferase [Arthrobacter sp. Y-9]
MTESTFSIEQLVLPESLESPEARDFLDVCTLSDELVLRTRGNLDLATPNRARFILWRDTEYARLRVYFVRLEGRVVARAWIHLPLKDNLDTAWLSVGVHPDFEGRGLGRALADHLEAVALSEGRTVVQMGTEHPTGTADDDGERLLPPTGSGSVPAESRAVRFARRRGYELVQVERTSVLEVSDESRRAAHALLEEAAARAEESYELVTWFDETPEDYVEDLVRLSTSMSTEIPLGGLELGEEVFDAGRVREIDARRREGGVRAVTTAARHRTTGELAGYSVLEYLPDHPEVGEQDNTLVLPGHRGHALGQWMKAANFERLLEAFPAVRRIYTYNADENQHMLAINIATGFRPAGHDGQWQAHLDGRAAAAEGS